MIALGWPWLDVRRVDLEIHAWCWAFLGRYKPPVRVVAEFKPIAATCRRLNRDSQCGAAVYPAFSLEHALSQAPKLLEGLTPISERLRPFVNGL